MADLEKLSREHARLSDLVRQIKKRSQEAAASCDRYKSLPGLSLEQIEDGYQGGNCIHVVFQDWEGSPRTGWGEYECSFEELYAEAVESGDVCTSCQNVRRYKAERVAARRKLGRIRAALTRVGRRLLAGECEP